LYRFDYHGAFIYRSHFIIKEKRNFIVQQAAKDYYCDHVSLDILFHFPSRYYWI